MNYESEKVGLDRKTTELRLTSKISQPCCTSQSQPGISRSASRSSMNCMEPIYKNSNHKMSNDVRRESDTSVVLTEDTDSFIIGNRVWVGGTKPGSIAYIGETQFAPGDWAGVVLDEPIGKNDGSVAGSRYFQCAPKHGIFSRLTRLTCHPLSEAAINMSNQKKILSMSPSLNTSTTSLSSSLSHYRDLKIGDRVIVSSSQGSKTGVLKYLGTTEFATGDWCGVELDDPVGKNDGSVADIRYFQCPPKHGLFALVQKVSRSPSSKRSSLSLRKPTYGALNTSITKTSSRESLTSLSSITSTTSNNIRGNITGREKLKEKQQEIDMLRKERNLERERITKSAIQADNAEQSISALKQEYSKYREETEKIIFDAQSAMTKLLEEKQILNVQLEDEKKKCEDLLFRFEEESINNEDIQKERSKQNVVNIVHENTIQVLEGQLNEERKRITQLEYDNTKLFEVEEELATLRSEKKVYSELQSENLRLNKAKIELEKQILELESKIADLENNFQNKELDIQNSMIVKIENLQQAINDKSVLLDKTHEEHQSLSASMTIEIEELQRTVLNLRNNVKENELIVNKSEQIIDEKNKELQLKNDEINIISFNIKKFHEQIDLKDKDIKKITETLQEKVAELEKYEKKLSNKEAISLVNEKPLENLETTIEKLKNQLKILDEENLNIRNELKIKKNQMTKEKENFMKNIDNLSTINTNFEIQVSELQNVIKFQNAEKCKLEKTIKSNSDNQLKKIDEISTEIAAITIKLNLAEQENVELKSQVTLKDEEIKTLLKNNTELEDAIALAQQTITNLENELKVQDNNFKEKKESLAFSNKKINELNIEKSQLEARISAIISSSANSSEQLVKHNEELTLKDIKIAQHRQQISQLDILIKEADHKLHEKNIELESSSKQIDGLKCELLLRKENYKKLSDTLLSKENDNSRINTNLEKQIENLINERETTNVQNADKMSEITKKLAISENNCKESQNEIGNLEKKILLFETKTSNLELELKNLNNKNEKFHCENTNIIRELRQKIEIQTNLYSDLEKKNLLLEDKKKNLSDKISTEEKKIQELKNFGEQNEIEVAKIKEELHTIKSQCKSLRDNNNQLECDVLSRENIIKSLNEELEAQKNENINITTKKAQYEEKIISLVAQNKKPTAIQMDLKKNLETSENKIQQYVNEIKNLEEKISKLVKDQCRLEKENSQINLTLQKALDELKKNKNNQNNNNQLKFNEAINDHSLEKIIEDNETYKGQIDFLNSVIVEMQKKNKTLLCKIEVLEMRVSPVEAIDLSTLENKLYAQRMFCDICDRFDLHETEDCHMQSQDFEQEKSIKLQTPSKSTERPYCENCEMFGHDTSSCDGAETF
ncbi:CAP-Gly domain-containing linker protein 1-like isoform X2 [Aphidius gifuensis]|uniref:CAP-Gly domain-containing linker protein 1-like isoform X2 n=1 Tax=Aphidius gifuensis TaxID=684658 RepID=UPI001CDC2C12|nr:CAP-Gly domain-containing linker protein 1-like isoform X2 [Aphidius gifuensis]